MKKGISILSFLLIGVLASAQNFVVDNYNHFIELDNSTVVHVAPATFQLAANVVPDDEDEAREIKEFIESIRSFDLVAVPDLEDPKSHYNAAVRKVENSHDELLNIKETDGRFSLFIDETGGTVNEIIGVGTDDEEFIVFALSGEMEMELIGEFIGKIQSEKLDPLKKVTTYGLTDVKVYPNPTTVNGEITVQLPEDLVGAEATLVDVNGKVMKKFTIGSTTHQIKTSGLQPGYYFVNLTKDEVNMKKKVLVIQ